MRNEMQYLTTEIPEDYKYPLSVYISSPAQPLKRTKPTRTQRTSTTWLYEIVLSILNFCNTEHEKYKFIVSGSKSENRQWIAAIIGNSTIFMMGMFLGWSSPVIEKLQNPNSNIQLTDDQISWMVSLVYAGSVISPLPTGIIMDRYGRKTALYFTAAQAILSWVLVLITQSANGIYASRLLGGLVGGSGITVAPVYLGEIAEPGLRGGMNALFLMLMFSGIVVEYILGPLMTYTVLNAVSLLIVIILTLFLLVIPESPYYYIMVKNRTAAVKSLTWLRSSETESDVDAELNVIDRAVSENMKNKTSIIELVKYKGNRRALFLAETLAFIQRSSGISVIMAYASTAAPSSWVLTNNQCAVLIGMTWIAFSFVSTKLINRFGRRVLLIISCLGCGVAQASYGTFNYLETNTDLDLSSFDWFQFASLTMFSTFYPIGVGCVSLIIQGEVFPANVKGMASGVTSIVLAVTSFVVNKIYQPIGEQYGVYVNYWLYATSSVFGIFFATFILIETKGKTLFEIQNQLSGRKNLGVGASH